MFTRQSEDWLARQRPATVTHLDKWHLWPEKNKEAGVNAILFMSLAWFLRRDQLPVIVMPFPPIIDANSINVRTLSLTCLFAWKSLPKTNEEKKQALVPKS
jgi:hypothetical protein